MITSRLMPASEHLPSYLSHSALLKCITQALEEDLGTGDVTSEAIVPPSAKGMATVELREPGVVAGLYVAEQVCAMVDSRLVIHWSCSDGDILARPGRVGTVHGPLRSLLAAERLALNFLQRMSGIATSTHHMVEAVKGFPARVRDTRKTAPGLRQLDKWAVRLGGGANHRMGLYDRILIKDNHIAAVGSLAKAVVEASRYGRSIPVDVEARTLEEVSQALELADRIDLVLLDNMVAITESGVTDVTMLQAAVDMIGGQLCTEASGNVTLATVRATAATGVDYISCGALTHSVQALDIGLTLQEAPVDG